MLVLVGKKEVYNVHCILIFLRALISTKDFEIVGK